MKIIVQKFGGTSLSTQELRNQVINKIINAKRGGFQPVVVVSAMGRKGDPYATDTLLEMNSWICKDVHPREMDLLISCGEIISTVILANTLKARGYEARAFTGGQAGIITDSNFMEADILDVRPDRILDSLAKGRIPIVAGFQGVTENGDFTTLGRGGSDVTAVALAGALSAFAVEIYSDVDGIMTADPKIVTNACVLSHVSYSEVLELASKGAKVIHPRAVEYAIRDNIPLFIKNTSNAAPGTIISCEYDGALSSKQILSKQVVTGIAHIADRIQVTIFQDDPTKNNKVLTKLADNHISIDIINILPDKMIFTIEGAKQKEAQHILKDNKCRYSILENCSKISVVGGKMRGVPGVMSAIVTALSKNNIQILQTADSHTTISCLVKGEDTSKAVIALHEEFELYKKEIQ
ncbi:MAG: aspartate kinase [Clostridiales bacterium]|nr:aspartate kinase [Clostridiales bacterium]